jgi:prevent-host-death family protein
MDMREVTEAEAKAQLSKLLQAVEQGEIVTITRNGETIAHLVPDLTPEQIARKVGVANFLKWRATREPTGMTTEEIVALVREGRPY